MAIEIDSSDSEYQEIKQGVDDLASKMHPYARPIIYIGVVLMLLILMFVGFAAGAYKICSDIDGHLDGSFVCHEGYYNEALETKYNITGVEYDVIFSDD